MDNFTVSIISSLCILLIFAAGTFYLSKLIKCPYTILLVLVGFIAAHIAKLYPDYLTPLLGFKIHPDIILYACLPTLLFESAFSMDARQLRHSLVPVLTLAIPGLFLSTAIIGVLCWLLTSLDFLTCLLLGAILSATDPVAVISIFKNLGVTKRLSILVEGESLLNDSTAIVTAKTIVIIMLAGVVSTHTVVSGFIHFFEDFFGGVIIGGLMSLVIGYLLSKSRQELVVELSLTLVLAYLSFFIATYLKTSGVMASITAGIMMASWGRTKLSGAAVEYLSTLLKFLAYIANSLIFLLLGFSIQLPLLWANSGIIMIVIMALLISRAVVIYGLIPLINKLPHADLIDRRYQTIMWWGGLRGAIALAIVFGLTLPNQEFLASIVMGVVLFTILVQGFSLQALIHKLKLDLPPLIDRIMKKEAELGAEESTLKRIPELQQGGLFSLNIAEQLAEKCQHRIEHKLKQLSVLRNEDSTHSEERRLIFISCFSAEKSLYYAMFNKGHLSEKAFQDLNHYTDLEIDAFRYPGVVNNIQKKGSMTLLFDKVIHTFERYNLLTGFTLRYKIYQAMHDYEIRWGWHQGSIAIIKHLDELAEQTSTNIMVLSDVKDYFEQWHVTTKSYLDYVADQFPEFVTDFQRRLAERVILFTKQDIVQQQARLGLVPEAIAEDISKNYLLQIQHLNIMRPEHLALNLQELLRKIPFFQSIPNQEMELIASLLTEFRATAGEVIIREGDIDKNLYLILRGVVRVIKRIEGVEVDIATLMAGEFFGEIALLYDVKRTATCKAITPCIFYKLSRSDFNAIKDRLPELNKILSSEAKKRQH